MEQLLILVNDKEKLDEAVLMLRRFKNHCEVVGYPSKSFKTKVKKFLKNST